MEHPVDHSDSDIEIFFICDFNLSLQIVKSIFIHYSLCHLQ